MAKPKVKASTAKTTRPATPGKKKTAAKAAPTAARKAAAKSAARPVAKKAAAKAPKAKSPTKGTGRTAKTAPARAATTRKAAAAKPAARKAAPPVKPAAKSAIRAPAPKTAKPAAVPAKAAAPKKAPAPPPAAPVTVRKPAARKTPTVPAPAPAPAAPAKGTANAPGTLPADKKPKTEPVRKAAKPAAKAASPVRKVINLDEIKLPEGYRPSPNEEYMCPLHLAYFKQKLLNWRQELILESQETLEHLRTETRDVGDEAERASRESDNILELRTRDRYRKLLNKIDQALKRIEDGSYGYCEETGEEIGLGRLEARPIATLTVDAQERREMLQRQFRDDH